MSCKNIFVILLVLFFPLLTFNFSLLTFSFAFSVDEEIARIQSSYERIEDITGSFVQKSHIKDLKRTDTYTGEFLIKRPSKMKWEYKGETPQEVFIKQDEIIIYQKKAKQAFKGKFDRDTYGQAPIALLGGFGKIQEEFTVTEKNGKLVLKPKKPMGVVVSIEIKTSEGEFPIGFFVINDSRANRIEITLKNVKTNTGVKNEVFEPLLPRDVEIHEIGSRD